jgi:hypothetical protein
MWIPLICERTTAAPEIRGYINIMIVYTLMKRAKLGLLEVLD